MVFLYVTSLHLDFDVAAGGEGEVHEAIDSLGGRFKYVYKAFVNAHFKLFAAFFVHVRAFYDRKGALAGRQWNGASQGCTGTQRGVYDLLGGLVNDFVVVGL